jgi:hypothetical protein
MSLERDGGMILTGENRRTRRKTFPSATLSTTNLTWIDPDANPGLCGERPATNDLSHGTAPEILLVHVQIHIALKCEQITIVDLHITLKFLPQQLIQFL